MSVDPELITAFQTETRQLIQELLPVIEQIKNASAAAFPSEALATFAQKIDRIMGTAKTFAGFDATNTVFPKIAKMAELCKAIGYKASEKKDPKLLKPVAVIWADVLKVLEGLVANINNPDGASMATKQLGAILRDRLKWLSEQLGLDFRKM